jgi:AraC-like DNA-binding protein
LQRVTFTPPLIAKTHMEAESCFIYPLHGESTVYSNLQKSDIKPHEGALMKCGRYLNRWYPNADDTENEVIVMHLFPDVLKCIYNDAIPDFLIKKKSQSVGNIQVVRYNEALKNFMFSLRFYFDNPNLMDDDLTKLKLKELILLLYNAGNENIRLLLQDLFEEEKVSFRKLIHAHIFESLTIEDLAYLSHLSLSSFKRKFKETFDASPAKYIRTKRLEKAIDLLKYSDKRIVEIAYDCGFNDAKVFTKSFKATFNISPSDYRKKDI